MLNLKTTSILKKIYPQARWSFVGKSDNVFLTFDDGPHPETTLPLLDLLDKFEAKASFFLIGEMVEKHPELFLEYKRRGHAIGNHSFAHLNGWKSGHLKSLNDFEKCESIFQSPIYRPPYGKIFRKTANEISKSHQIVMWDFLVNDFKFSLNKSFELFKQKCKPGSIVVFHENEKSKDILLDLVEACLTHLRNKKWSASSIQI